MRASLACVDPYPIVAKGLACFLGDEDAFEVVAHGATAADAIMIAANKQPAVTIIDISARGDVFAAIGDMRRTNPAGKILIFTAVTEVDAAVKALEAGANGYVLKSAPAEELISGIKCVLSGETFITPSFAMSVITALRTASLRKVAARASQLSSREDQVIRLLLHGKTNKEIASKLSISEKTVKHYMTLLMHKLNARNRIEVVLAAQKLDADALLGSRAARWEH